MADFEKASRLKLRFTVISTSPRGINGNIGIEDLWDLDLETLNTVGMALNKQIKEKEEGSLIKKQTTGDERVKLGFDIVKHIIDTKLAEQEKRKLAAERKVKKDQIIDLISKKQTEELGAKSVAELMKELEDLGD